MCCWTRSQGLPDNPLTQDMLNLNRRREHVTMSVLLGDDSMTMNYEVFRDRDGRETLSYLLQSARPDPRLIGRRANNTPYYDLNLRTSVIAANGKPVYNQEDEITANLTDAEAEVAKKKRFAAEGRVPLAPGKYTIIATLTNNLNRIAARQHADVTVPAVKGDRVVLSDPLAYSEPAAVPDPQGQLPFSASGFRFTPRGAQSVDLREGERLPLTFQIWMDPKEADAAEPEKIHLHYVFGAVSASHDLASVEDEEVDASNRDKEGNLLTGHTLDTSGLAPGTYRLVVGANRVGEKETAYGSMNLHVQTAADFVGVWTAYGAAEPGGEALDDLKRGLSADAQGADADAQGWYTRALAEGSRDMRTLDKLAAVLKRRGEDQELAALIRQPALSRDAVAPKTLLAIAQALTKTGNPRAVVQMLEKQIKLQPPDADLYRSLADACETTGDSSRARDLRALAEGVK